MMEEVRTGGTYSIGFLKQLEKITNILKCKHLYRLSVHKPEVACTFINHEVNACEVLE